VRSPARDACPGLLALHQARDGGVARIRLPGGYVSGPRWQALARLARDLGDGHLDLTSRGNVQLRGIRAEAAAELGRRAAAAGLLPSIAHDRARNIMASPLAGLGGRPSLRLLVRRLDAVLLADPALATLPGRFLFSLDDGTGGSGLAGCDIGLRRVGEGVEVIVAGRRTGVHVRVRAAVTTAATAARAAVAAGVGSTAARIADLGDGGQSVAAAIGGRLGLPACGTDTRLPLGIAARDTRPSGSPPAELVTVVLAAPLSRLTSRQIEVTASVLAGREAIRIGIAGRLVIPLDVPVLDEPAALVPATPVLDSSAPASPAAASPAPAGAVDAGRAGRLAEILTGLEGTGLIASPGHELADVTACSGAACSRSLADVRAVAAPVSGHPRPHWSGCDRTCGLPPDAEPVIAADSRRYLVPGAGEPVPCEMLVAP
jgi:precorrin-3B synthase